MSETPSKSTAKHRKPKIPPTAPKRLYLIRHGQSEGQVAKRKGLDRQRDQRLRDAHLTHEGVRQAIQLVNYDFDQGIPELVVSSPLTRALHTAILGFPNPGQRILVHYDLAEVGSRVPENTPRPIHQVLKDLEVTDHTIDALTLLPNTWPTVLYDGKNNRGKAIRRAMQYLYAERIEETIAVVCHFNVIREILEDGASVRPQNAVPIVCQLYPNGKVKQKVQGNDVLSETRKRLDYC
jgi:broad specificity phosphatase PhoE